MPGRHPASHQPACYLRCCSFGNLINGFAICDSRAGDRLPEPGGRAGNGDQAVDEDTDLHGRDVDQDGVPVVGHAAAQAGALLARGDAARLQEIGHVEGLPEGVEIPVSRGVKGDGSQERLIIDA